MLTVAIYPFYLQLVHHLRGFLGDNFTETIGFTILLTWTHVNTYVVWNGFFGVCDYFGYLQEYKLGRRPYMIPKRSLIIRTIIEAVVGQLVLGPLILYFSHPYLVGRGLKALEAPLPSALDLFMTYTFAGIFNGFFFYWAHRSFHSQFLYARFHKQHHEYTGAIGICAEYADPLEQILANIGPSIGGVLFFGCKHPLVVFVWLACRLQQTYEAHSGYCFEGTILDYLGLSHAADAAHHDYHHSVNRGNFGASWMDWICGTEDGYFADGGHNGYVAKKKLMEKKE